jgi:NAD(P)-dependent dehydrogenase (short-subunit alcohol dehydrogenase family)
MSALSTKSTDKWREVAMTTYPNRFAGKTAVVTGAAQGIGRDVALRLAREGARVALVDRSDLVDDVRQDAGAEALSVIADLEGFAGATAAMERARARFGRIDILVNNVVARFGPNASPSMRKRRSRQRSAARSFRPCGAAEPCCR